MQPLEWWVSSMMRTGVPVEDESTVFTSKFKNGKLLLVENQEEYDLASALQLIYGGEVTISIGSRVTLADIGTAAVNYGRVYTSWDPLDSQR